MENNIKIKLSLYGLTSAISFIYLMLINRPGISVLIFAIIQFVSIFLVINKQEEVKNIKGLFMFLPIFILSLNYYISGSFLFLVPNFLLIILLYSTMILLITDNLPIKELNLKFIFKIIENVFMPITHFNVPFKWFIGLNKNENKKQFVIRVLLGIFISIPCVFFLIVMLSSADMVFSSQVESTFKWLFQYNFNNIFKIIFGTFTGLYLFGLLYIIFDEKKSEKSEYNLNNANKIIINGDILIINILLFSILFVYTLFVFIQFKYLFAGSSLPNNLSYSQYARRGFFELVFLSILNVGLILITIYLLKNKIYNEKNKWSITKIFMIYLCAVTFIMLISSFYRMSLYDQEYGFTRLRLLVYGFLIFEFIGLLITLKYIINPNFNIIAFYLIIGLCYYLSLNVIQMDNVIAKRNIDMYFEAKTKSLDIDYLMSLSTDAAPGIKRLINNDDVDILTKYKADKYFENIKTYNDNFKWSWQSSNLSLNRAVNLLNDK